MQQKKILVLVIGAYLLISFQMVGNRLPDGGIATGYALQYYKENALAFATEFHHAHRGRIRRTGLAHTIL